MMMMMMMMIWRFSRNGDDGQIDGYQWLGNAKLGYRTYNQSTLIYEGFQLAMGVPQKRWIVFGHGNIPSFDLDDGTRGSPMT